MKYLKYTALVLTFIFMMIPAYNSYDLVVTNVHNFMDNWYYYVLALICYVIYVVLKNKNIFK
jgi:amino acid permease